jgi:hypothetical protein
LHYEAPDELEQSGEFEELMGLAVPVIRCPYADGGFSGGKSTDVAIS